VEPILQWARNKRSNRKGEFLLNGPGADCLCWHRDLKGIPYPREELDKLWKTLLINQFHDILPGTSIYEVYEVTKKEYAELKETGNIST
jgi:alpha-mannosidase